MPLPPELSDLAKRVNNWGRWGDDDEIGTLNLITDETVRRAAACIRKGKRFSLALPLSADGPQTGAIPGRINPLRTMTAVNRTLGEDLCYSDDVVVMGLQAATHWDALSHVSYDGRLYNGFPADSITESGAARCAIDKVGTLAGRGVLLDVARSKGAGRLEPGYAITPDDLEEAEKAAVGSGDIVLVRTGHIGLLKDGNRRAYGAPCPGLSAMTAEWFHARDVAAVATDTLALEVLPPERPGYLLPLHALHLVEMGMTQGQNFDLDELGADCADDGVYEFFLEASPEPFVRGVGSPVNPVAIK